MIKKAFVAIGVFVIVFIGVDLLVWLENIYRIQTLDQTKLHYFEEKTVAMKIDYDHNRSLQPISNGKIVIIIDDVTTKTQLKKIEKIPYLITVSFLPPTLEHKNSAKISATLNSYMIHLPLEANNYKYEENNTLHTNSTQEDIDNRIAQINDLFPKAKYINNHTGSKFTAEPNAIDKLFKTLKRYNYGFLDSRTTPNTITKEYAKKYGIKYLSRNIFLDNIRTKEAIIIQLRKAIFIARSTGLAIAIGHPHSVTLETLYNAKDIFGDLEIVLVDDL